MTRHAHSRHHHVANRHISDLKNWLNQLEHPIPPLAANSTFDDATKQVLRQFKTEHGITPADDSLGPEVWAAIGQALGTRAYTAEQAADALHNVKHGPLDFRQGVFFEAYMRRYGALTQSQFDGLSYLLTRLDHDADITDIRWVAYMLATVKHECGDRWQPIEEFGKGAHHTYGHAVNVTDEHGVVHANKYYGRGYVQLTWDTNYRSMGAAIGLGQLLYMHPERALEQDVAYRVMSYGMRHGSFRGHHSLGQYITGARCDYYDARNIINGKHDKATTIQGYATAIEAMLRASLPTAASTH